MKKNKYNIINFILLIQFSLILSLFIITGFIKETNTFNKILFFIENILLITYSILESINQLSYKKKVLKKISKSFFVFGITSIYALLYFNIINNILGFIILIISIILNILSIIFNCINYRKTSNILLIGTTLLSLIFLPIVLLKTNFNPFYILLIGYLLLDSGIIVIYIFKRKIKNLMFLVLFILGIITINIYLLKYVI